MRVCVVSPNQPHSLATSLPKTSTVAGEMNAEYEIRLTFACRGTRRAITKTTFTDFSAKCITR